MELRNIFKVGYEGTGDKKKGREPLLTEKKGGEGTGRRASPGGSQIKAEIKKEYGRLDAAIAEKQGG